MKLILEKEEKEEQLDFEGSVEKLLKKLRINPETVLVAKNGEIVDDSENLENNDTVMILSVVSGG
jgi:thiamine biosynthesis protein ThiS